MKNIVVTNEYSTYTSLNETFDGNRTAQPPLL